MDHEQDFARWAHELQEANIPSLTTLEERRKYRRRLIGVTTCSIGIIIASQLFNSPASAETKSVVASPETFSYTYTGDEVVATVPTPNASDRSSKTMSLHFSCDEAGRLTVENTSSGYIKAFDKKTIAEMIAAGVAAANPCDDGLTLADTAELGPIASTNGFATYSIPNNLADGH